jgi:hypothetical protein
MREKMRDPVSIHLSDISQSYQRRYDLESVPGSAMSEKVSLSRYPFVSSLLNRSPAIQVSVPGVSSNGVAVSIQTLVKHEEDRSPPGPYDQTTTVDSRTLTGRAF